MAELAALNVHDPQDQGSREHPLPSHESSNTHVPENANQPEQIFPSASYRIYAPNNHYLDVENDRMHNVLRSILRRHPLHYALTARADVPEVYVQQAWHTMVLVTAPSPPRITFQVGRFEAFLNYRRLRDALRLPLPNSRPGMVDYIPFPSNDEVFQGIQDLGYSSVISKVKDFNKKNLPPMWHDLFMILNRCLTSKAYGSDSASIQLMKLFHAVAYNLHVDLTFLFWLDLIDRIKEKSTRPKQYLPFMRFLGLFVQCMLQDNPQIPPHVNFPRCHDAPMTQSRPQKKVFAFQRDLPVEMVIQYARPEDADITAYCASRGIQLPTIAVAQESPAQPQVQTNAPQSPEAHQHEEAVHAEHHTLHSEEAAHAETAAGPFQTEDVYTPQFEIPGNVLAETQHINTNDDIHDSFNLDVDTLTGSVELFPFSTPPTKPSTAIQSTFPTAGFEDSTALLSHDIREEVPPTQYPAPQLIPLSEVETSAEDSSSDDEEEERADADDEDDDDSINDNDDDA